MSCRHENAWTHKLADPITACKANGAYTKDTYVFVKLDSLQKTVTRSKLFVTVHHYTIFSTPVWNFEIKVNIAHLAMEADLR